MEKDKVENVGDIFRTIPHRHPFLLVDQITSCHLGKKITGRKSISYNEWYFQGLPTSLMIVPASILSEAIAQLGAMLILRESENQGKLIFFSGLDKMRFRKPVQPGETLEMSAEILRRKGRIGRLRVEANVDNKLVFEGIMQFALE
jgi:3-hydroxymyristoyl/3-hydroxydecanoyl-(acyl carrier protein) dehydratase